MEIIIGKTAGFCFGVKRAVDGTLERIKDNNQIYCLGELVHSKQVIQKIQDKGIKIIDDISEIKEKNAEVIIRAHGIEKKIYEIAKQKQLQITDYTCPFVLKIHQFVEQYSKNDFYIFLIGNKKHPETIGTSSYCGNNYTVIEKENEVQLALQELKNSGLKKLLLIVQTTFRLEKFEKIVNKIKIELNHDISLEVKNTICNATKIRQDEANVISKKAPCMIIVGGKNSSNTRKLYDISLNNCKNTFLLENEKGLEIEKIKQFEKVGIMAGTSTPYESINKIVELLKEVF